MFGPVLPCAAGSVKWPAVSSSRNALPQRLQAAIALRVAARVVEPQLLAQEIGQLGPVDEFAAVIQQAGDIG